MNIDCIKTIILTVIDTFLFRQNRGKERSKELFEQGEIGAIGGSNKEQQANCRYN